MTENSAHTLSYTQEVKRTVFETVIRWFKSTYDNQHHSNVQYALLSGNTSLSGDRDVLNGSLVKWLRHHPFTVES